MMNFLPDAAGFLSGQARRILSNLIKNSADNGCEPINGKTVTEAAKEGVSKQQIDVLQGSNITFNGSNHVNITVNVNINVVTLRQEIYDLARHARGLEVNGEVITIRPEFITKPQEILAFKPEIVPESIAQPEIAPKLIAAPERTSELSANKPEIVPESIAQPEIAPKLIAAPKRTSELSTKEILSHYQERIRLIRRMEGE